MEQIQLQQVFKALSEMTRLRIMALLVNGELCVCDLTEVLGLPQSTVSRHMSQLRLVGLVQDRRDGKWVHYRLTDGFSPVISKVIEIIRSMSELEPYKRDKAHLLEHLKSKTC